MTDVQYDTRAPAHAPAAALSWPDDRFASRREASDLLKAMGLKVEPQTLARWFCQRSGPPVQHFGSRVVYRVGDLRAWVAGAIRPSSPPEAR
jgi:hypothetical protein